jgi:hypothetical protein
MQERRIIGTRYYPDSLRKPRAQKVEALDEYRIRAYI